MYPDTGTQAIVFSRTTLSDLDAVALKLVEIMGPAKVCILKGELGAGKTTFIKAIGKVLGVEDGMSSPSFSIINEYQRASGDKVYHFDFYRLKSELEASDIGVEEYFYSGEYCFVEWPENIPSLLPEVYAQVRISIDDLTHRTIEISLHGRKEEERI